MHVNMCLVKSFVPSGPVQVQTPGEPELDLNLGSLLLRFRFTKFREPDLKSGFRFCPRTGPNWTAATLAMVKNPQFHKRSKHIARRWHWVRELVEDRIITVMSCRDPDQTTDVLTKALPRPKHRKHATDMGLVPL